MAENILKRDLRSLTVPADPAAGSPQLQITREPVQKSVGDYVAVLASHSDVMSALERGIQVSVEDVPSRLLQYMPERDRYPAQAYDFCQYVDSIVQTMPMQAATPMIVLRLFVSTSPLAPAALLVPGEAMTIGTFDATTPVMHRCIVPPMENLPALDDMTVPSGVMVICQHIDPLINKYADLRASSLGAPPDIYDSQRNLDATARKNIIGSEPESLNETSPYNISSPHSATVLGGTSDGLGTAAKLMSGEEINPAERMGELAARGREAAAEDVEALEFEGEGESADAEGERFVDRGELPDDDMPKGWSRIKRSLALAAGGAEAFEGAEHNREREEQELELSSQQHEAAQRNAEAAEKADEKPEAEGETLEAGSAEAEAQAPEAESALETLAHETAAAENELTSPEGPGAAAELLEPSRPGETEGLQAETDTAPEAESTAEPEDFAFAETAEVEAANSSEEAGLAEGNAPEAKGGQEGPEIEASADSEVPEPKETPEPQGNEAGAKEPEATEETAGQEPESSGEQPESPEPVEASAAESAQNEGGAEPETAVEAQNAGETEAEPIEAEPPEPEAAAEGKSEGLSDQEFPEPESLAEREERLETPEPNETESKSEHTHEKPEIEIEKPEIEIEAREEESEGEKAEKLAAASEGEHLIESHGENAHSAHNSRGHADAGLEHLAHHAEPAHTESGDAGEPPVHDGPTRYEHLREVTPEARPEVLEHMASHPDAELSNGHAQHMTAHYDGAHREPSLNGDASLRDAQRFPEGVAHNGNGFRHNAGTEMTPVSHVTTHTPAADSANPQSNIQQAAFHRPGGEASGFGYHPHAVEPVKHDGHIVAFHSPANPNDFSRMAPASSPYHHDIAGANPTSVAGGLTTGQRAGILPFAASWLGIDNARSNQQDDANRKAAKKAAARRVATFKSPTSDQLAMKKKLAAAKEKLAEERANAPKSEIKNAAEETAPPPAPEFPEPGPQ